jgi:hypothetical protein
VTEFGRTLMRSVLVAGRAPPSISWSESAPVRVCRVRLGSDLPPAGLAQLRGARLVRLARVVPKRDQYRDPANENVDNTARGQARTRQEVCHGAMGGPPCGACYSRRWCGVHARIYLVNKSANINNRRLAARLSLMFALLNFEVRSSIRAKLDRPHVGIALIPIWD